jgi:hypothetical protein
VHKFIVAPVKTGRYTVLVTIAALSSFKAARVIKQRERQKKTELMQNKSIYAYFKTFKYGP